MKKSRPVLSKTFTSALADMDSNEMDKMIIKSLKTPKLEDAKVMLDDYMLVSMEMLDERIGLIDSFLLTRGQSGTTDWLSNFLIDSCMPNGKFSEEIAFMSSEIMKIAFEFKKVQKLLEKMEQSKTEEE